MKMANTREADMTISGTPLTEAQSMVMRVALQNFTMFLIDKGLGAKGEPLKANYLARIRELNALMAETAR